MMAEGDFIGRFCCRSDKRHLARCRVLSAVLALLLLPAVAAGQISLQVDPAIAGKTNYQLWLDTTLPAWQKFANLPKFGTLKIVGYPGTGPSYAVYPDTISIPIGAMPAQNPNDVSDPFDNSLSHEFRHLATVGAWGDSLICEAVAESGEHTLMQYLYQQDQNILRTTAAFAPDLWRNYPKDFMAGDKDFYAQGYYDAVAGPLELFSRGWFKDMDTALDQISSTSKNFSGYLALFDRVFQDFDGKRPSTIMNSTLQSYYNGPDGLFFWVFASGIFVKDQFGRQIFFATSPVLDQQFFPFSWYLKERKDGVGKKRTDGAAKMQVQSAYGVVTVLEPFWMGDGSFRPDTSKWQDGAYQLNGCWVAPGMADCDSSSPTLHDTEYFAILRTIQSWWNDYIFVFANGPEYGEFGKVNLSLASAEVGVSALNLPGLLAIKLNGSQKDIKVTDGTRTRVFTPAYASLSRFALWTDRDQPYLYAVVNAASFSVPNTNKLQPGAIYAAFGWEMAHENPVQADWVQAPDGSPMLPNTLGRTKVVVTANGVDYTCPLFYAAQRQVNFQMPVDVPIGQAEIRIVLGTSSGNRVPIEVVDKDPGTFVVDWSNKTAAVVIATGPKSGQISTKDNPAPRGETVSLYVTGLGPVSPYFTKSGVPPAQLSITTKPVTVTVGGVQVPVLWSGLAPTFVGLYQVNIEVPGNMKTGAQTLVVTVDGKSSDETKLFIQ